MKLSLILCCALVIVAGAFSQEATKRNYVPNSETAVAIAEAVLIPVYGKKDIESERPYKATLKPMFGLWLAPCIALMASFNRKHIRLVSAAPL